LNDTKLEKQSGLEFAPARNDRGHGVADRAARPRSPRSVKRLPIAVAKREVQVIYPAKVEELCQVLVGMLKRILSEERVPRAPQETFED
jgi:hypothetical protein